MNKPIVMNAYRLAVALVALIFLSATALAAPTEDQVRQVVAEKAIPNWKRAAAQIADVKDRLPSTPFQETWTMLDDLLKSKSGTAVLTRASNPRDAKEIVANSSWLRWKILTDKADGRYSIDTSGIKAELVSDEEWKRLRRKVLDDVFSGAVKSL